MLRIFALLALVVSLSACDSTSSAPLPQTTSPIGPTMSAMMSATSGAMLTSNSTGIGGAMPAFCDAKLFTINFTELPPGGESSNLSHNGSINNIYQSDGCKPGGKMFVSVIDAIPMDGFNPLWQEVQVLFNKTAACPAVHL
jgi:hypothetical protein